jgi:hypothetical protein
MLILLILLSDLVGIVTILFGLVIALRDRVNFGLGYQWSGTKAFASGLVCVLVGLALIRFNHAMANTFPEGLGH